MRVLTASAACLSVNPSAYCITITRARRQADSAGCPFSENKSRKSSSRKNVPNSSRIWVYVFPFGKMARAISVVSSGTGGMACGCNDIGSLLAVYIFYFFPVSHISLLPIRQHYLIVALPSLQSNIIISLMQKGSLEQFL